MPKDSRTVTLKDLAKAAGRSRQAVYNALGRGLPPADEKGRYDLAKSLAWFAAEEQGKAGEDQHKQAKKLLESRRLLRQCEKQELELAILRRQHIPVEEVTREVSRMVMNAKQLLLALPSSLASTVVGLSPAEAERQLRDGILRALDQLATGEWQ